MGSMSARRHSIALPRSSPAWAASAPGNTSTSMVTRWLGMTWDSLSNQNLEMRVRIAPLSGMGVGRITSKALTRSEATSSRCPSTSNSSRTLPEPRRATPGRAARCVTRSGYAPPRLGHEFLAAVGVQPVRGVAQTVADRRGALALLQLLAQALERPSAGGHAHGQQDPAADLAGKQRGDHAPMMPRASREYASPPP